MTSIDDLRAERRKKLDLLHEAGMDPYPSTTKRSHTIKAIVAGFKDLADTTEVSVVGRIMAIRGHGALIFVDIDDGTGRIQAYIKADTLGKKKMALFESAVDIGDFIEITGTPMLTKRGEKSVLVADWQMLAKTLLPLPEKWAGVKDVELKRRQRYLDLLSDESAKERFIVRTKIIDTIRTFLNERGFMEVETPTLQPVYGGGFARPFVTHHEMLDSDFYLRISDEMYLKRLIVGGFNKVYEITKVFRNEGLDADHNPEFTMFEAQIAYEDYHYGMDLIEEIFETVAKEVLGDTKLPFGNEVIDVKRPWKRMTLVESVKEYAGVDPLTWQTVDAAHEAINKLTIAPEKKKDIAAIQTVGELIAFVFEECVEEKLIQPTIIYDYPVEVSPLAKKKADDPRFAERFEYFAFGSELGNNYSELNDPLDLHTRFVEEKKREQAGFDEAHQTDEDYLEAIEHGFPPTCGLAIGIDRMVMLYTNTQNIKDVIFFPTLRPKE